MSIPFDHNQALMAADPLHGGQIDAGLHKVSDGRVAKGVAHHLIKVETCCSNY